MFKDEYYTLVDKMNELIEQITKQVDEYFDDLSIEFSNQAWREKFVELIVRECAQIAWLYDEPKLSGHGSIIANRIEKHFGIEE